MSAAKPVECGRKRSGLVVDEQRVDAVGQDFAEAMAGCRDDRGSGRECLEHHVRESFVPAGEDERVGARDAGQRLVVPSAPSKWTRALAPN